MNKLIYPALLLAALSLPAAPLTAWAQTPSPPPPTHNPSDVRAGTYMIEPDHTQLIWGVLHLGFTTYYGRFSKLSGRLILDPQKPESSSVEVSIPIDTVSTTSEKLDDELKGDKWLDAGKYPTATFKSTKIVLKGQSEAEIVGDLSLHGVTKPLTLYARFNAAGSNMVSKDYQAGFEAMGTFKRSDFGVAAYVPLVGDEVKLIISAAFKLPG